VESVSRPLTCRGFAATLDIFGFSADDPDELAHLAAELAHDGTTHPVFEAMLIHINQCDHCVGISDPQVSRTVAKPRFRRIA
jgi:hypothetical protein